MKQLGIVAVGLALVVGIVVGGVVGNLFGATAQRTSAAAATGTGCYTNWNSADCAAGWTAVSTGVWTAVSLVPTMGWLECVQQLATNVTNGDLSLVADQYSGNLERTDVQNLPCAICCATGPSVVGGFAELPALAGPTGTSGMGSTTYAVLAGAAAGVLAFAVLATLSVKRWRVR